MIGARRFPLTEGLGSLVGFFPMDFTRRGVARHGGVIVEAFDADAMREAQPARRQQRVDELSSAIARCIDVHRGCGQGKVEGEVEGEGRGLPPGCSPTGCVVDGAFRSKYGLSHYN